MGQILLDETPVTLEVGPPLTFAQTFEKLRDSIRSADRIVLDVEIDGQPVIWGDGSLRWSDRFAEQSVLAVHTSTTLVLAVTSLEQVQEALPTVAERHRAAADALRHGDGQAAMVQAMEALAWWQELQSAVGQLWRLCSMTVPEANWQATSAESQALTKKVTAELSAIKDAFSRRDLILVADILEYELSPLTERWNVLCQEWRKVLVDWKSKEGVAGCERTTDGPRELPASG